MGDLSEKVILFGRDIVGLLKDKRDPNKFNQSCDSIKAVRSSCDAEFDEVKSLLQDYENKIEECRQKTEAAKSEVVADEELDLLHIEQEEECKRERLLLEELRVITNEINDLERTGISVQERNQTLKKIEQDELRAQRTLSMFASVTNVIPDLYDPSKVSGHIVDRDKKVVKKFEFDPTRMNAFDMCDSIWTMIARDMEWGCGAFGPNSRKPPCDKLV